MKNEAGWTRPEVHKNISFFEVCAEFEGIESAVWPREVVDALSFSKFCLEIHGVFVGELL